MVSGMALPPQTVSTNSQKVEGTDLFTVSEILVPAVD